MSLFCELFKLPSYICLRTLVFLSTYFIFALYVKTFEDDNCITNACSLNLQLWPGLLSAKIPAASTRKIPHHSTTRSTILYNSLPSGLHVPHVKVYEDSTWIPISTLSAHMCMSLSPSADTASCFSFFPSQFLRKIHHKLETFRS